MSSWKNQLYFGDNLDILRKYVATESVDLIYLDPPFNSKADYNVLFKSSSGEGSVAQAKAFKDTWEWDEEAANAYHELITGTSPQQLKNLMQALKVFLTGDSGKKGNAMMAYLTMMALRLVELHRVLKPTGSLYLHCDPTASHYIKLILDSIFGFSSFRNEINWKRVFGHGDAQRFANVVDIIFYYVKGKGFTWHKQRSDHSDEYVESHYKAVDEQGRQYQLTSLVKPKGSVGYFYPLLGCDPPPNGWRMTQSRADQWLSEGRIILPSEGSRPRYKRFLDEMQGVSLPNLWDDLPPINSQAKEALGYPTQKPEALLERIMKASSNDGDVVLDPFCGCGTTIVVAEKLNRRWIGIDITPFAVDLMERRLVAMFSPQHTTEKLKTISPVKRRRALKDYWEGKPDQYGLHLTTGLKPFDVRGIPEDLDGAKFLFEKDPIQFEYWCVSMVGAQPNEKKGADRGIDGVMNFLDGPGGEYQKALVSVKGGGNRQRENIATLKGDMAREKAKMGILITLEEPTGPMKKEAADAGMWDSGWNASYPVIQLITVQQLLDGYEPKMPKHGLENFKVAQKAKKVETGQSALDMGHD